MIFGERQHLASLLFVVVVVALNIVMLITHAQHYMYVPIVLAWLPMVRQAIIDMRKGRIGNDFFLVVATIVALIAHQEQAIMIVLTIMLIAHYIESLIELQTKSALESLIKLMPREATVINGDAERTILLDEIAPGMHVVVKAGSRIPVDGVVLEGTASVNESALTGESNLQEKSPGSSVFAQTIVEAGRVVVEVQKVRQETLFGRMLALLEAAEQKKAQITVLTDKIAFIFTPTMLFFIGIVWFFTRNSDLVVTLLVFGSPLELALIAPLTILAGSVAAFRHGILIKGGRALEQFSLVDTVVFDKTGTLTLGEPHVVHIKSYVPQYTQQDILRLAAIAEKHSEYVLAKSILHKAHAEKLEIPSPESYTSLVGHGVEVVYQGKTYFLGNKHFTEASEHAGCPIGSAAADCEHVHSSFYLSSEHVLLGKVCVADTVRADAGATIAALRTAGIHSIILLSGDRKEVADAIAQELGIEEAHGEIMPDQKLAFIEKLQQSHRVAMVGDGINDAAALKKADVGIAMGAMGMEPAIDAADIVLMTSELQKIYFVRLLAQRVFVVIKQNLLVGFVLFHTLGVLLTLGGFIAPIQAALVHAVSDILILLNAGRLVRFRIV